MSKRETSDPLNRRIAEQVITKDIIIEDMIEYSKLCASNGLIYGNFGNLSVKYENNIYITRSGAMMGKLVSSDIIVFRNNIPPEASSDTPIHFGIYQNIGQGAVFHMHGDFTIVLSLLFKSINPCDFVGQRFLGKIPIVDGEFGTAALNNRVVNSLKNNAVIVKGHGSFTFAEDIRKAFVLSCALETSCKLLYYRDNFYSNRKI